MAEMPSFLITRLPGTSRAADASSRKFKNLDLFYPIHDII
jgi:hypothetical protein